MAKKKPIVEKNTTKVPLKEEQLPEKASQKLEVIQGNTPVIQVRLLAQIGKNQIDTFNLLKEIRDLLKDKK